MVGPLAGFARCAHLESDILHDRSDGIAKMESVRLDHLLNGDHNSKAMIDALQPSPGSGRKSVLAGARQLEDASLFDQMVHYSILAKRPLLHALLAPERCLMEV